MSKVLISAILTALMCAGAIAGVGDSQTPIDVDIHWSSLGIPHIQAGNERSLGYGVGYAYALDNICLLADEVLTARGERAKFLGRDGRSSAQLDNVKSDAFFLWLNRDTTVAEFWQAQPEPMKELVQGYVAGFNRYLRDTAPEALPIECRGGAWLRPLNTEDVVRLIRRLLIEGGVGRFAEAVVTAVPPEARVAAAGASRSVLEGLRGFAWSHGSNAIAVGGQRTENGKGRLLANPHFPWFGALRFYQMHLTIPGRLDVMGAALPGFPLINIGFNRNLAWTHTVDSSRHFTLHRLHLDPKDSKRYTVDGKSHALKQTELVVVVKEANGRFADEEFSVYESSLGPLIAVDGMLPWSNASAYALQDPNLANTRVLEQWYAMNRAYSLDGFRKSIQTLMGIPWVNTLVVDDQGRALYMNVSVAPNVSASQLAECADKELMAVGLPGLDGGRGRCNWQADEQAVQPGIVSGMRMPVLQRTDYVQNSNDSAWLSNPAAPLTGFSPLVSAQDQPLGLRTRYALTQLSGRDGKPLSEDYLERLVTDNRVYLADLVLDDLLDFCEANRQGRSIASACDAMSHWDRRADLDSGRGLFYFQELMLSFESMDGVWAHPFDPKDPLDTPRGIAWKRPEVAERLATHLRDAVRKVDAMKFDGDVRWGDVQFAGCGSERVPVGGGEGQLGIYNAIQSQLSSDGKHQVVSGSSYIQLVSFDEQGPVARGILAFSQSSNPASSHFCDQTKLFSRNEWPLMPFTAEQIAENPPVKRLRLRE